MEAVGTVVLSVAQTLFAALECAELKEFFSFYGYESQLHQLQNTVETIKAVFQDAERKRFLSAGDQKLLQDLKDAVYEADDLLDEFVTIAEQKQLLNADGGISKKMRRFLQRTNPFGVAKKMSKGVKKIKKKLDAIVYNKEFRFDHDPEPIRMISRETGFNVNAGEIIGREQDLKQIVGMLLDPDVERDVSFLGIVGIGGMGKTALAQLLYNDPRIVKAFTVRKWGCISDEELNQFDVKDVLGKILASKESTLNELECQIRHLLANNRYLFVLDDVWTENREQWCNLVKNFVGGQKGSWIVVTTRSLGTAEILGDGQVYELEGLSKESSWKLFQMTAFKTDKSNLPRDLVEIGQGIVQKCAQIPLAIRVVGSLLYGQDKRKWQSVHEIGLANIRDNKNDIMPILKLSYYHLESPLKSCFSYCAIFPKDFRIEKQMLISLWIAQGYVVPLDEGQSVEDAGEEYFLILLRRCFFQDVSKNHVGDISSIKMHDLIHDIAQSVSAKEIIATSTISTNLNKTVRHFSTGNKRVYENFCFKRTHIRSLIYTTIECFDVDDVFLEKLIVSCRRLRALDLSRLRFANLPNSIGTLLHIRYLDLSCNDKLEVLPKSIAKLCNLQTLNLSNCRNLNGLPRDCTRLVKLRALDITYCDRFCMPRGMDKLTCLSRLSHFIVNSERRNCSSWKKWFEGLEEIKDLTKLERILEVDIKWPKNVEEEDDRKRELYLRNKKHLDHIRVKFIDEEGDQRMDDEGIIVLMEDLHPHPNLKSLDVYRYPGTRIPDWVSHLPNLVKLEFRLCKELEYLANFGSAGEVLLFPLLEKLVLQGLPRLKGFYTNAQMQLPLVITHIKSLEIWDCPELMQYPVCPNLEFIKLMKVNKRMIIGAVANPFPKLKEVEIDNLAVLNEMPIESIQSIVKLCILNNEEVENLGEFRGVFCKFSSSLRKLKFKYCDYLRRVVRGGLEHLTALEELEFDHCEYIGLEEEEVKKDEGGEIIPCPSLLPSLNTLKLEFLPHLENLPSWMQFLTSLQTLEISSCNMKAMPNWMPKLTSLRNLRLIRCFKSLKRRCQKDPSGEDWPLIQHIPSIYFF